MIYTYAMACPSEVDVPRPSSSNATNELRVAEDCINDQKYVNGTKIFQSNSSKLIIKFTSANNSLKVLKHNDQAIVTSLMQEETSHEMRYWTNMQEEQSLQLEYL